VLLRLGSNKFVDELPGPSGELAVAVIEVWRVVAFGEPRRLGMGDDGELSLDREDDFWLLVDDVTNLEALVLLEDLAAVEAYLTSARARGHEVEPLTEELSRAVLARDGRGRQCICAPGCEMIRTSRWSLPEAHSRCRSTKRLRSYT
jgi:hypothetical protein